MSYLCQVEPQADRPGTQIDPAPAAMTASSSWSPRPNDAEGELGRRIFEGACAGCRTWNGNGRETDYAALAGSQAVNDPEGVNLARALLMGADLKTSHGAGYMPSFRRVYTDTELAAVANYVHWAFRRQSRRGHRRRRARTPRGAMRSRPPRLI